MTDADYAALTIWGEASGEPIEGRIAVACVLRNRLHTRRWGTTYEQVCLAPAQFSCWSPIGGAANYRRLMALKQQVAAGVLIDDVVYLETRWVVDGVIRGIVRDRVQQATHYLSTAIPVLPAWAMNHVPVCRIGGHVFFAGIA